MNEQEAPSFVPLEMAPKEREILLAEPADDEIAIRPDVGALYMPEVMIRNRLNAAFGPGGWTLWQNAPSVYREELGEVVYDATLIVRQSAVARASGSIRWKPGSRKGMTFSDASEAAKSSVLRRCAKDLGVGSQMWDKTWCEAWRTANASRYEVMELQGDKKGEVSYEWHRNDSEPSDTHWRAYRLLAPRAGSGGGGQPRPGRGTDNAQPPRSSADPRPATSTADGGGFAIRDPKAPATDKQIAALEKMCEKIAPSMVEAQLSARGVGCLRELNKGEASALFTWAKAELEGNRNAPK